MFRLRRDPQVGEAAAGLIRGAGGREMRADEAKIFARTA